MGRTRPACPASVGRRAERVQQPIEVMLGRWRGRVIPRDLTLARIVRYAAVRMATRRTPALAARPTTRTRPPRQGRIEQLGVVVLDVSECVLQDAGQRPPVAR